MRVLEYVLLPEKAIYWRFLIIFAVQLKLKAMDKELQKLMSEFDVSEEALSNSVISIDVDVTGRRKEILSMVEKSGLSYEDSDEDNMDGKDLLNIGGSGASVFQLLNTIESSFGSYCMIGITILATATVIFMSIPEARKALLSQIKGNSQSNK